MRSLPLVERARRARAAIVGVAAAIAIGACANPAADRPAGRPAGSPPVSAAPENADPLPDAEIALVNPGFEYDENAPAGGPKGWYTYQHAGETSYLFTLDGTISHWGAHSMRIDGVGFQPFGSIAQNVPGSPYAGKTVRFSGWLRTTGTGVGGSGASLFVVALAGGILAHNFMAGSTIKGTTEWRRYAVTLALPPNTEQIRVGATLKGKGSLWFDDAHLAVVGAP
jgi:hypothetical protein